jgi:bifunctional DNA-binding transcriptional regulator/antitoxin component of YhaV-PrlF toxin-antitoxin module
MTTVAVELAKRGQLTIPKAFRDQYGIKDGQTLTLLDIGGALLVSPRAVHVDAPADALRDGLLASGATLDGMLADLRRRREANEYADADE